MNAEKIIADLKAGKKWYQVDEVIAIVQTGEVPQKAEKPAKVEKAPAPAKMKKAAASDAKKGKKSKGSKKSKAAKDEAPAEPTPQPVEVIA